MDEHPIQGLMTTAMENLKEMIDANTIIGDPVQSPDGTIIIPVSKLGFGFAAGGTEFHNDPNSEQAALPFGGGSGGGVSITPVAFLIVHEGNVKLAHLNQNTHIFEKLIEQAPAAIEKIKEFMKESNAERKPTKDKRSSRSSNFEI